VGELDAMIAAVRKLATLGEDAAKIAAPLVDEAIKSTVRAGTDPDGNEWLQKKGGGAPLVHAADHISTSAVGKIVRVTLTGVDVYHHFGAGVPRRQILPDPGTIPTAVGKALQVAADRAFYRAVA
jgi:hypothetical protein